MLSNIRLCKLCGEEFEVPNGGRRHRCPDCIGNTAPRDTVTELEQSEAVRLNRGLREMYRAGR